jgi:hypothetical protein
MSPRARTVSSAKEERDVQGDPPARIIAIPLDLTPGTARPR